MANAFVSISELTARTAKPGSLIWIGIRPERRAPMLALSQSTITVAGLEGDRSKPGKRAVTLMQAEHLPAIASYLGLEDVMPEPLRRNLVVQGINLLALRDKTLAIGQVHLRLTGPCAPCSRMEEAFGHGGYSAVRGHGGMTAEVIRGGAIEIGCSVRAVE